MLFRGHCLLSTASQILLMFRTKVDFILLHLEPLFHLIPSEEQVLGDEIAGRNAKEAFIRDIFMNGPSEELFFDPKLKTMEKSNKTVKLTASDEKVIQFLEQSDLAFMLLVKSQLLDQPLDLDELMSYSLTPVPHCLGTPDGFIFFIFFIFYWRNIPVMYPIQMTPFMLPMGMLLFTPW